jgi:hypothetical protein
VYVLECDVISPHGRLHLDLYLVHFFYLSLLAAFWPQLPPRFFSLFLSIPIYMIILSIVFTAFTFTIDRSWAERDVRLHDVVLGRRDILNCAILLCPTTHLRTSSSGNWKERQLYVCVCQNNASPLGAPAGMPSSPEPPAGTRLQRVTNRGGHNVTGVLPELLKIEKRYSSGFYIVDKSTGLGRCDVIDVTSSNKN